MSLQSGLPAMLAKVKPTDSLGCVAGHLIKDQELSASGAKFFRKRMNSNALGHVETPASDRGFLIGISMDGGHRRRIFHEHHSSVHDFEPGSVYIRNFQDDYNADLTGSFDFLLMEISPFFFERTVDDHKGLWAESLKCMTGMKDEVLSHLAWALAPALERPGEASSLFVDQMSSVIATHLHEKYGGGSVPTRPLQRRLSRQQETRAKDMLRSNIDGNVLVSEIADACQLSRSYFTRSFKETTGQTPHQWQIAQRVDMACGLLGQSQLSLAEIAATCGFADQSHFTRVFSRATGQPPGTWRRAAIS